MKVFVWRCFLIILFLSGCATPPKVEEMNAYEDFSYRSRQEMIADFKEQFEGQCVHKNIVPTICECKIIAVNNDLIVLGGPRGKFVHKFDQKPEFSTGLAWYYIKAGNNIEGISLTDKTMALEIYHLLESIYLKTQQKEPDGVIPGINAKVTHLKFFEAGRDIPPLEERKYTNEFVDQKPFWVYWEIKLMYPRANRKIVLPLDSVFYDPQGKIVRIYQRKHEIQPGWTNSLQVLGSCGKKFRWAWSRGEYRVEVYYGDKEIARRTFTIR